MAAPDVVVTKNVSLVPSPFAGPPNIDNQDIVQAYDACGGFTDDMTNGAYGWSSSVPAVATLPTRTLHTVGVGTATGATHIQLQSYVRPSCRRTFTIRSSRLPSAPPRTAHRPH